MIEWKWEIDLDMEAFVRWVDGPRVTSIMNPGGDQLLH